MSTDVDFTSDLNNGDVPASGDGILATDSVAPATTRAQPQPTTAKTPADTTAKPLSLRDQISSALKGEEVTPPAATEGGVARGPDGKFITAPAADTPLTLAPGTETLAAPVTAARAPNGIDSAVFNSLPAETQASLARTMEDIDAKQNRFAVLGQVEQLIEPRRQAWALNGMTEAQAINQLLALSDFAGRDPGGFIKYMAENSGVNLEDLVLGQEVVDPATAELRQRLAAAEAKLSGYDTQQQRAAHENTVSQVVAFASEKGQDGSPLRPYFEELGQSIMPHISAIKAQNPTWSQNQVLQTAYDNACWGTPSVRAKMQGAVNAAAEAERLRTEAERVGRARTASVSVRSGAPSSPAPAPTDSKQSLRDTIRASMAAQS